MTRKISAIETRIASADAKQSGVEVLSQKIGTIEGRVNEIVSFLNKLKK